MCLLFHLCLVFQLLHRYKNQGSRAVKYIIESLGTLPLIVWTGMLQIVDKISHNPLFYS